MFYGFTIRAAPVSLTRWRSQGGGHGRLVRSYAYAYRLVYIERTEVQLHTKKYTNRCIWGNK